VPVLEAACDLNWRPQVLVAGSLATPHIYRVPPQLENQIVVAFSTRLTPGPDSGDAVFARFAARHRLENDHPLAQRMAFASLAILEEALKRAGRDVTQDKLVTTLEELRRFATGVFPPISFGPNQRIGAPGAYLTRIKRASRSFVTFASPSPILRGE
jgi:hypothetical protein